MPNWPTHLRDISTDVSGAPTSSVLRTPMGSGAVRQRKVFTTCMESQSVRWSFTPYQYAIFKYFWKNIINQGADWFTAPLDFGDGELVERPIRLIDGKFGYRYNEGRWDITAQVEIEQAPTMSEEDYELFTDELDQPLVPLELTGNRLHRFVHYGYPSQF